jgi:phospholipid/cholesterol/gamma-HCH transport system ATP-binding protein
MSVAPAAAPLIRLERVGMRFGAQEVLRDLQLEIHRHATTAIIGASGCGKTVLLKLVIGLLQPTTGRVLFDGKELAKLSEKELAQERLRFGFLFQGAALFDSLSVYENVAFPLREHTDKRDVEIASEVRQRLEEVGLPAGVEAKRPAELSGGMKKRVGLARAIIMNPEVMLYDEPTTGLDPVMSEVINDLIRQLHRSRGVTGIVVTHDLNTVRHVADRVVMLAPLAELRSDENQIVFDGDLTALTRSTDERVRRFVKPELVVTSHAGRGEGP